MPKTRCLHEQARMLDRQRQVSTLYLGGKTQYEIAELVGVTQATISNDLRELRDQWLAEGLVDFDQAKAQELAKIDNLERIATEAWLKSTQDAEVNYKKTELALPRQPAPKVETVGEDGKRKRGRKQVERQPGMPTPSALVPIKEINTLTRKGQAGDPRFLERIAWCIEMRCKIKGIVKEEKAGGNNVVVQVNWDGLLDPSQRPSAQIEARIVEASRPQLPNVTVTQQEEGGG